MRSPRRCKLRYASPIGVTYRTNTSYYSAGAAMARARGRARYLEAIEAPVDLGRLAQALVSDNDKVLVGGLRHSLERWAITYNTKPTPETRDIDRVSERARASEREIPGHHRRTHSLRWRKRR